MVVHCHKNRTKARVNTRDMYGHEIVPVGEDFGVSLAFARHPHLDDAVTPYLTVFHSSDGFRQSLFTVGASDEGRPHVCNVFDGRLREVLALLKEERGKP